MCFTLTFFGLRLPTFLDFRGTIHNAQNEPLQLIINRIARNALSVWCTPLKLNDSQVSIPRGRHAVGRRAWPSARPQTATDRCPVSPRFTPSSALFCTLTAPRRQYLGSGRATCRAAVSAHRRLPRQRRLLHPVLCGLKCTRFNLHLPLQDCRATQLAR